MTAYIVQPLLTALFATIGGLVPIGIFVFVYSVNERHKLRTKAERWRAVVVDIKKKLDEQDKNQKALEEMYKDKAHYTLTETKEHFDLLLKYIKQSFLDTIEIARYENLIAWADHYNFWSVIENIFERRFTGEGPAKQGTEELLQRAASEAGLDVILDNEVKDKQKPKP